MADLVIDNIDVLSMARRHLGQAVVNAVQITAYTDASGDPAYAILVVLREFDPKTTTAAARFEFVRDLLAALKAAGEERFPYVSYATVDEMADASADD